MGQPQLQEEADRRRSDLVRTSVSLPAKLIREGGPDVSILICNLSGAGFMGECEEALPTGCQIVISLPGAGMLPAEIRWARGGKVGGLFQFELSARELGLARHGMEPSAA